MKPSSLFSSPVLWCLLLGTAGYMTYPRFHFKHAPLEEKTQERLGTAVIVEREKNTAAPSLKPAELEGSQPDDAGTKEGPIAENPTQVDQPKLSEFDGLIPLHGQQAKNRAEVERRKELLERAAATGEWAAYQAQLKRSLLAEFPKIRLSNGRKRYQAAFDEALFLEHLMRWKILDFWSPSIWEKTKDESALRDLVVWLMQNPSAMEQFLITVKKEDDATKVVQNLNLVSIYNIEKPEMTQKYFNLLLACSVVLDQPLAFKVTSSMGSEVNILSRFKYYTEINEAGLAEAPIDRLSASDLVFVVGAPVIETELRWALEQYRSLGRRNWGKTYSDVTYLMERAVNGLNPYDEYTLPEILEEGGICMDQAYFSVNCARAAGIPAIELTGMTDSGGHAWSAIKTQPEAWDTTIGRIGGVAKGEGRDPQTGNTISEQDIWHWSQRKVANPGTISLVHQHLWLADFISQTDLASRETKTILECVKDLAPEFPQVWERWYAFLTADPEILKTPTDPKTLEIWKDFIASIRREFKENPRMGRLALQVEDEKLFPHQELGEIRRGLARERGRIDRKTPEQADLIAESLQRECRLLEGRLSEGEFRVEVGRIYDRALRDFGGSITGFKMMAEDYFARMKSDTSSARKAVSDIEAAFSRVVETGTVDWFRAKTEVELHRLICQMYREIGEEKRAANMEKRLERQMKKAEKAAL